jgi:hypothetical protein
MQRGSTTPPCRTHKILQSTSHFPAMDAAHPPCPLISESYSILLAHFVVRLNASPALTATRFSPSKAAVPTCSCLCRSSRRPAP